MSGGKHTPGPWWVAGKGTIRAGDTDWIGGVHFRNREANARLIAASPTMAEYIQRKADAGDHEASAIMETIHAAR
jgi:hypothetical protein